MHVELRKFNAPKQVHISKGLCLVESQMRRWVQIFSEGEHRCVALAVYRGAGYIQRNIRGLCLRSNVITDHIHPKGRREVG